MCLLAFTALLILNAWVVDDAYITFRTVDNFVHGYGLRWNVAERVQVFTHPLWMFLFSGFYVLTHEAFYTSIALNIALSVAAVLAAAWFVTRGFRERLWKAPFLLLALASCKAFVDYTSSGLENGLSYLLSALFFILFFRAHDAGSDMTRRQALLLVLLASLMFLNHADGVLLVGPALLSVALAWRRLGYPRGGSGLLVAASPAIVWVVFSVFYYGFPFPNTAYAKVFCTGFPWSWKVMRGAGYLANSVRWDWPSYAVLASAVLLSVLKRERQALVLLAGVFLHIAFVVWSGGAATHMSGRFFSVSLFTAIVLFVRTLRARRVAVATAAALALFLAVGPVSPLKFGTPKYRAVTYSGNYIDTKWYVLQEGAALLDWRPGKAMPDHAWYHAGEQMRDLPDKVVIGGAPGSHAIGYFGFAVGPGTFVIDTVALSDPLLARLPAMRPASSSGWKSAHFPRAIPDGYVGSVRTDRNLVADPKLHRYYGALRRITRGPLFSLARLRDILYVNLGWYPTS